MIKAGIIGGAGYTGGELLRLLLPHPEAKITGVHSTSQSGKLVSSVHKDLVGDTDLIFQDHVPEADVLFLCLGHQRSREFIEENQLPEGVKVIDLSQDFRLHAADNPFIYGLPELQKSQIKKGPRVANPGCFATAIQLALLPLAQHNLWQNPVHIHAVTGSTGAGLTPLATTHFSWRQNNLSVYKPFQHQHLHEIRQSLSQAGNGGSLPELNFIPIRGNFTKGIFCTAYLEIEGDQEEFRQLYEKYYEEHPFTLISPHQVSLKEVINTNKCLLHLEYLDGKLLITSVLDNLVKGASGQAVQNMNLMFGLQESSGLLLKASGF